VNRSQESDIVSVSSLQSNNWIPPFVPQPGSASSQSSVFASIIGGSAQRSSNTSSTSASSATETHPFQQLAADVQEILSQGQNATATTSANATTTDPTQQLATDLQSIYGQLEATQSDGNPGTQTPAGAQSNGTAPHHHHHDAGGTSSPSSTAASGNVPNVAQTLSAEMMQALQAYASSTSATSVTQLSI
jgi:hypothetical protein